jgi:hypothetical protein
MTTRQRRLHVDDSPDLRFQGETLADVMDEPKIGGRWTELSLYRTARGRYVCYRVSQTQWVKEDNRYEAATVDTIAEVIAFFGQSDLAKEIYIRARIDNSIDPDTGETPLYPDDAKYDAEGEEVPQ